MKAQEEEQLGSVGGWAVMVEIFFKDHRWIEEKCEL